MTTLYVDLSQHDWNRCNGNIGWASIKAATSAAVCLRATYGDPGGTNYATLHFQQMAKDAKAAGFTLVGGYHNLIKGDQASINRQVDWLRSELDKAGSNWAMLDVERYEELVANGLWPRWDDVQQFAARWAKVDDRVLAGYIPRWLWEGHLGKPDLRLFPGPLVSSNYGNNPDRTPKLAYVDRGGDASSGWAAYGGRTPEILQYGSNTNCPGASGQTDSNAFRGTFADLTKLLLKGNVMTISKEDLEAIREAVWKGDNSVQAPRPPYNNPDYFDPNDPTNPDKGNKWWAGQSASRAAVEDTRKNGVKLDDLAVAVAGINTSVAAIAGIDVPTSQEIVNGVLAGLGQLSAADVADALKAALTPEQVANLVAELSA